MTIKMIPSPVEGPVLRGDVLGGALLRGDCMVPVNHRDTGLLSAWVPSNRWDPIFWRLDCRRSEVHDRIVRVLAAGELCDECGGHGADGGDPCVGCCGSCYTRAPLHLGHVTDAERRGTLPAEAAAWFLWVSVLRADAGLPVFEEFQTYPLSLNEVEPAPGVYMRIGATLWLHGHLLLPHPAGVMRIELEVS